MASYSPLIKPSALKELEAVVPKDRRRIVTRIEELVAVVHCDSGPATL